MDVHIPHAITLQLRHRGIDVLTSQEDGTQRLDDSRLLDRASSLGRVLVTQDDDLLREAALRQNREQPFVGVVYASALRVTLEEMVVDLELLSRVSNQEEWSSRVEYLPLK
jgi:predicted nuclease of predicted toxin-antitoxin system